MRIKPGRLMVHLVFYGTFVPLVALYLAFATPILGNMFYLGVHDSIDAHCTYGGGSGFTSCYHNGVDIGALSYSYSIGVLALGLNNPVLAVDAVKAYVPPLVLGPWICVIAVSFVAVVVLSLGKGRREA